MELGYSKAKFPPNLNCKQKLISETAKLGGVLWFVCVCGGGGGGGGGGGLGGLAVVSWCSL